MDTSLASFAYMFT